MLNIQMKQKLEQKCEGMLPNSRQCVITGYDCDHSSKDLCNHYRFIAYRINQQKANNNYRVVQKHD
jgi:hypothetical protein